MLFGLSVFGQQDMQLIVALPMSIYSSPPADVKLPVMRILYSRNHSTQGGIYSFFS